MSRIESPSSINMYKQCPRKYYYRYIEKLPVSQNKYTILGSTIHKILERFFTFDPLKYTLENYKDSMKKIILELYSEEIEKATTEYKIIGLNNNQILQLNQDSKRILVLWLSNFVKRIELQLRVKNIHDAIKFITPKTETILSSDKHRVRGFADAIFIRDDGDIIIDYKTSSKADLTEEYILQLAIYALTYKEKFGKLPKKVGIEFLKHGIVKVIDVDTELLKKAVLESELIQLNTQTDSINDYPKKTSGLCKWKDGQCDFYDICFK